jgi:hypothetical protein
MNEVHAHPARPSSRPTSYQPRRRRRVIRARRAVAAALVAFVVVTGWSLSSALRAPGDDTVTKLAEWGRDHGLGPVVTLAESIQYRLNPPVTGGTPDTSILAAGAHGASSPRNTSVSVVSPLPRVPSPVTPALAGEGVWVPTVTSTTGPLVQETYVRPDAVHTSYLTGIAWMSHRLRFALHPGYQDPGTNGFTLADQIMPSEYSTLVATFNGGFKLKDARGGIYDHGTTVGALVPGAASFVVYADGHATVGTWGRDVSLTSDVVYVRQNLQPLISRGRLASNLDGNVESDWGATLGGAYAVWRSGIGVTKTGDLVYAAGDALTVSSLADLLHRAGAVTAMQLDINKAWISYMTYGHSGGHVVPHKLVEFQRPASRYLQPTSRDFIAAYAPSA